jgi:hypothetical protein
MAAYFVEETSKFDPSDFYSQLSAFINELLLARKVLVGGVCSWLDCCNVETSIPHSSHSARNGIQDLLADKSLLAVPKDHSYHTPQGTGSLLSPQPGV